MRGSPTMAMLQAMTQATQKGAANVRISARLRRVPQGLAHLRTTTPTTYEGARDDRIPQALRGLSPRTPDSPGLPPQLVRSPSTHRTTEGARNDGLQAQALRGLSPRLPQALHLAPLTRSDRHVRTKGLNHELPSRLSPLTTPTTPEGARRDRIPQAQQLSPGTLRLPPQLDTERNGHVRSTWLSRRLSPLDATCERRGAC